MIETTIQKIRKDFSDQAVFNFCHGGFCAGMESSVNFDIDKNTYLIIRTLPGKVQPITIDSNWGIL